MHASCVLAGITAIEVAEGAPPHSQLQGFRVLRAILHSEPPTLQLQFWSATFRDFIRRCLVKLPEQRPTALELMSHAFITSAPPLTCIIPLIKRFIHLPRGHKVVGSYDILRFTPKEQQLPRGE